MKSNIQFELVLLKTGETLKTKTKELIDSGVGIASIGDIKVWVENNPDIQDTSPIVIADPTAEPKIQAQGTIILVPAYGIGRKGKCCPDGWIDFDVPMWPKEAGGQLAILTAV
jgi:hypothetical protein